MSHKSSVLATFFVAALVLFTSGAVQAKTLKIAYTTAKGGLEDQQMHIFKKLVDQKLPNYFDIKLYPGSQLGSGSEDVQAVETGTLDASTLGSEGMQVDPHLSLFELPWIFQGFDDFENTTKPGSPLFKKISRTFSKHDMKLLAILGSGFRDVLTKTPVKSLSDFKGMKVRISVSPERKKFWQSLGAIPVAVEWADTYMALEQGTVSGVEAFPVFLKSGKMYEQAKYLDDIHYISAPFFVVVSKTYWAELPQKAKQALLAAGHDCVNEANSLAKKRQRQDIQFMEGHGVKLIKTNLSGYKKIRKALTSDYQAKFGRDWLEAANVTQ